ncbi:MAG: HlyC/CorC family transporter [Phycisphaerales bacterium]|nr:HlyC/CorC family transporter [Phycisphaerales bacterium]
MHWPVWLILLALLGSMATSTLSYALRSISRVALEKALDRLGRGGQIDQIMDRSPDLALAASLLRIVFNLSVVAFTLLDLGITGPTPSLGLLLLGIVPAGIALLVFSVAIPSAWARYNGEGLIAALWPVLRLAAVALSPLILFLKLFDELVRRLTGAAAESSAQDAIETQEEILAAVSEGASEGAVDEEQKKMIEGVISFRDLQVSQIMTPRTDMITVSVGAHLDEVKDKILRDGLSRLPVYEGTRDNILGILYAKDLLSLVGKPHAELNLRELMRPPLFVPHSKPLRDLLRQFRRERVHMAIVLDEFGGTAGLITSEDILEEIVGDIQDEYEKMVPLDIRRVDETTVEVDARTNITDLNRELDLNLPEHQDYQTIGGFVITLLGTIPAKGEKATYHNLTIAVLDSDARRVKRVRIHLPQPSASHASATDKATGH